MRIAKKFYDRYKNLQFFHGDIYNFPKNFANFDLAIVRGVIHHVAYPEKAIKSIGEIVSEILNHFSE